jgi:lipopolysaccharide transport system permease protein
VIVLHETIDMTLKTAPLPGRNPAVQPLRELPIITIEPWSRWPRLGLSELWSYRGLLLFLVWRDIKVRYAQTLLGAGWAVLQPVLATLIFTAVFGLLVRVPSDGVPYSVFVLSALVPWTYFATALTGASSSLVNSTNLITKVYFPRLVIPLAPVLAGIVDFAIASVVLLGLMLYFGYFPTAAALAAVPILTLIMMMIAAGVGCWLAALNIQYRDIKHAVPFLVQVWMFASPIVYPLSLIPERLRPFYALNPMVGVVEGFRAVLLGTGTVNWVTLGVSFLATLLLLVSGMYYFRRTERVFADVA